MRILITNLFVSGKTGSETVVQILADGLRAAGHQTMLLAPTIGDMAVELRRRGHHVVDRVCEIVERPDIIHAQHLSPALIAMVRFPDVPVVYACHSALFEVEAPMVHPQIREWIAVDEACAERSLSRGVPAAKLSVVHNAVDLEKYARRGPLPAAPHRGLLLTKNTEHLAVVREACEEAGIALDELGPGTGRISDELEKELPAYDVVFATARMAIEAASVGCAVVVCDARGMAGMLSTRTMEHWRRFNLGVGVLTRPTTRETVLKALEDYDASDAAKVCAYIRAHADAGHFVAEHLRVYERALKAPAPEAEEVALASAQWVEELAVTAAQRRWSAIARELHGMPRSDDHAELLRLARLGASGSDALASSAAALAELNASLSHLQAEVHGAGETLAAIAGRQPATEALLADMDHKVTQLTLYGSIARAAYRRLVPAFVRNRIRRARDGQ